MMNCIYSKNITLMTKIKLNSIIWGLGLILLFTGCSNFDEINTNPEATSKVTPGMLCTYSILSYTKFTGDAKAYIGESAVSKYVGYAKEGQMSQQYNSSFGGGWFGGITTLPNLDDMVKWAEGSLQVNSYKGVRKFMRAWIFYSMTIQMGDVPYSETNRGLEGYYTPIYDSQEDVLEGILDELKEADAFFASGVNFSGDPTPLQGNAEKWRRLTNAFSLRILMSMSKKVGNSKIDIKGRFAEIVSKGVLMQPSSGFWGLEFNTTNKNPLYSTSDFFVSRSILSTLLVDNFKELKDRRLFYYGDPAKAQLAAEKKESDYEAYTGVNVAMNYEEMNTLYDKGTYSQMNSRYYKEATAEPRMLLTYTEQQLILAEARLNGWITTGTAKEYYESGVRAAMESVAGRADSKYTHGMAINGSYIDSYLKGEAALKTTESVDVQLKQVWLQRYFSNFMQDPFTSFYEYRRTGYPEFPIDPVTNLNPNANYKDKMPVRWTYPGDEQKYNNENWFNAVKRQYGEYQDEINQVMWLLK